MKNKMKIVPFFVVVICCLLTISCKENSTRYKIGVSQCSNDNWRNKLNKELRRESLLYGNVNLEIRSANDNNVTQAEDIRYFIREQVDLIIVSPNEARAITPAVEEAYAKGIPVIAMDRRIISKNYTAFVGANNYKIGQEVGRYIVSCLKGKGNVVEMMGRKESSPAIERHKGFMNIILNYPNIHLVALADARWTQPSARKQAVGILKRCPHIDIVYGQNDRMALGFYDAAKLMGREKEMRFVGVDALTGKGEGVDLVQHGILNATFIYPTGGEKIMKLAMDILQHKPNIPKETELLTSIVDPTNAHVMMLQESHISELDKKIETLNVRMSDYLLRFSNQRSLITGIVTILILFIVLFFLAYSSLRSKNRMNHKLLEMQQQLEEATKAKLMFYTNISHDFRTPLTLIIDPIEQLSKDKDMSTEQHNVLDMVLRNVNLLHRLIDQLLEFRKYESGKSVLTLSHVNLDECLIDWSRGFLPSARKHHFHFSVTSAESEDYNMPVDVPKMERVFYNLLSNAFKFTPENGEIAVTLSTQMQEGKKMACLQVMNTGPVISEGHINKVFDDFYHADINFSGTGIGLALVKAFVELHHGTISVQSSAEKGTDFSVVWPYQQEGEIEEQTQKQFTTDIYIPAQTENEQGEEREKTVDKDAPIVLVIDDNPDICTYLTSILQDKYVVLTAFDGQTGIHKAMQYVPDLIVSDLMMPQMDGLEVCNRLKSEVQTSHIPIILLTACAFDEQRIKGFDSGADSYISKPFNSQVLCVRVRNLIEGRKRLKDIFNENRTIVKESVTDIDQAFIERFKILIEEKMSDTDFNVDLMVQGMGLSRVQLYRKVKSLTNFSPNELLRQARLKRAASLLASSDKSVSEIAYKVGFLSPAYFTKCYKEEFGENPTELQKRKGK